MKRAVLAVACSAVLFAVTGVAQGLPPRAAAAATLPTPSTTPTLAAPLTAATRPPVLAYYYIWFDTTSWRRAKTDYPLAGRYSSDDAVVMRDQVRTAKRAGINGFIVSWKHTPTLDRRLEQLIRIAEQESFKLAVIYQGLDFQRHPQPTDTVARDLAYFSVAFAHRSPFKIFVKPLVIWSGTWEFSAADVARATGPVRSTLTILGSEKNIAGYARIASSVDGNAYYWSSVNPATYKGYIEKLADMSHAVHAHRGMWIAPAAVGFDARGVGGTTIVDRNGGATLRTQIDAALASSPEALGLISWNEYSENSHMEPSVNYGYQALDVVGQRLGTGPVAPATVPGAATGVRPPPRPPAHRPNPKPPSGFSGPTVLIVFGALFAFLAALAVRRARRTVRLQVVAPAPAPVSPVPLHSTADRHEPPLTRQERLALRRRSHAWYKPTKRQSRGQSPIR